MSFMMFHRLFVGILADPGAMQRFGPVVAMALILGAYGLTVVFLILFPQGSPVQFQARAAGISRTVVAVGEAIPKLLWVAAFSLSLELGGLVALGIVAPHAGWAIASLLAKTIAGGICAHVIVEGSTRVFVALRVPGEIARITAVLFASLAVIGMYLIVMSVTDSAAAGHAQPVFVGFFDVWGSDLGGLILNTLASLGALGVLVLLVILAARTDASGGVLVPRGKTLGIPRTGLRGLDFVLRELWEWSREPVIRLSIICVLTLGIPIVVAGRTDVLDVGLATIVLVVVLTSGSEVLVGRALPTAWISRAAGIPARRLYFKKLIPILMVQVLAMSIALVSLGATAFSQFAEAMSLFLAVQAMTVLAGTFVPFDVSGGLGMATTSLLAIGMDVVFLTLVGAVLQLSGTPAILFNLAWGIGMHMIAVALFRKQLASTV